MSFRFLSVKLYLSQRDSYSYSVTWDRTQGSPYLFASLLGAQFTVDMCKNKNG